MRIICGFLIVWIFHSLLVPVDAQPLITNTPVSVQLPTSVNNQIVLTPQTVNATLTPVGPEVFLEANASLDQIDVRDFPETGAYLGSLESGRQYRILGQYYSWLFFEYALGPNGRAWIYRPIVRIIGDPDLIPFVDPALANLNPEDAAATATQSILQQTPGFVETATAQAREIIISIETTEEPELAVILPTYTPPAEIVPITVEIPAAPNGASDIIGNFSGSIPPIVPIALLLLGGSIGMLFRVTRK
jgi:hypothetical protein